MVAGLRRGFQGQPAQVQGQRGQQVVRQAQGLYLKKQRVWPWATEED